MKKRNITEGVEFIGAIDWNRRLFDSLIPLPDGTSYNSYLIRGNKLTVLIDTVDPSMWSVLEDQLKDVKKIDYIVSHHTEQDHSGSIPFVLKKYPEAIVLCSTMAKSLLKEHLQIDPDRIQIVKDGEIIDLGGKSLKFIYTPWVHWPETMCTWLEEDRILFTCDLFGSHLATSDMFAIKEENVYEGAKRYYAEIMMPFRETIIKNMEKIKNFDIKIIAPSHGPIYNEPSFIINAYYDWINPLPKNECIIAYVSMHGSTKMMVEHLTASLIERDIKVSVFDLSVTDIGKLAISLVDAATLIVATPTVRGGAHPVVLYAVSLANMIFPKLKYTAIIGSYGWKSTASEQIISSLTNLKSEYLGAILCKGMPSESDYASLARLADTIKEKHSLLIK